VDFPAALAIWQEFLGAEPASKERYLSDLNELHKACRDAYSGNGKFKQNYVIRVCKKTLIEGFEWHHEELFSEVFRRMVVLYFNKASVNQKYLVQMMANHLQKLVRQENGRRKIEISERRLLGAYIGEDIRNGILDFVNSQNCSTDSLIERELHEMYQLALNMAYETLNKIELRIIIDDNFSYRKASQITGISKSTISHRLNKKLMKIREKCMDTYSMIESKFN
jgi:DNA-directed RNA polymerase specialized sigma24 family protein